MALIKDITIPICICGIDDARMTRAAKQRVVTWMIVTVAAGFAFLIPFEGFTLEKWSDPKGLVVLGLLTYCAVGIVVRVYVSSRKQKKHSLKCTLRRSFYETV